MSSANQYICDLNPYQPGLPIEQVVRQYGIPADKITKLASNENPFGPSPKALAAMRNALHDAHRYPEQYGPIQALAKHYAIQPEMIVLGNGSNDVLDLIARTFLNDGDDAISAQYAFAIYQIATLSVGARNVIVPAKDYGHDLAAMAAVVTERTKLVWLANPNNPTGTFVSYNDVATFLKTIPSRIVVVLDEAYFEYLADDERVDSLAWVAKHPNLIVTRTFSKIYGLAGLRIGYGVTSTEVAELLNRVRQPFNVNSIAVAAATAALGDDEFVRRVARQNERGRLDLIAGLKSLGLETLPAYGNFVTFRIPHASMVAQTLLAHGVIVRPLGTYGMDEWLRVTVADVPANNRFMRVLLQALPGESKP